jgi:hypothetical protein
MQSAPRSQNWIFFIYSTFYILIKTNNFRFVKFFHKCTDYEITSFAKYSKSRKRGEKGQSWRFQIVVSDENMRVVMNSLSLLLTMSHIKVSLFPDIFSFVVDKSWHFNKITPMEKMHNKGESGFFKKP